MSIETATQRLNSALEGLEAKIVKRLETLESDNTRLRNERDRLLAENKSLQEVAAAVEDTVGSGVSAAGYAELEKRNAEYRAILARTLQNIDGLITRVETAAK